MSEPRLFRRVSADTYAVYDPNTDTFSTLPAALVPPLVRADPKKVRLSLAAARPHEDDEPEGDDLDDDFDDEPDDAFFDTLFFNPDTGEVGLA